MSRMSSKIGLIAGDVWCFLSENGESSPIKIKAALGISNTMLYLALGWLSREDKIVIEQNEYSYKISLK
ncbi:MAG: winged helix-turn-helix domain-containing protein [Endomicrobium sp.]|nr:winged helix-turn-helix domain-containing protein [Endomicrobium sp.]MDR2645158.1 winged helix-turn-helix domain-containing protein [Endomicrobium sp.]